MLVWSFCEEEFWRKGSSGNGRALWVSVGGDVFFGVLMRVRLHEGTDFGCEGVN